MDNICRIAITPGEPAGIGPDLIIKLAQLPQAAELIIIADMQMLAERAQVLSLPLAISPCDLAQAPKLHQPGHLSVLHVPVHKHCRPGHLDVNNASYVLETLKIAGLGCLNNEFAAVITGPVHQGIMRQAGLTFTGQTNFFTQLCHVEQAVMLLACPGLRVAFVTSHIPLAAVPKAISAQRIEQTIRILQHDLQFRLDIHEPRILVCGLNPHAGEEGHLGDEEINVIQPVLKKLQAQGLQVQGPLPADTLFTPPHLQQADVILAMYHDQGLPVVKQKGFGKTVNITLGLPIIRTSVDHGVALALAGTGQIHIGSLQSAVQMAIILAEQGLAKHQQLHHAH
jgi:4-hydroxythreonine-4-phosphate dehydrogenase